MYEHTSDNIGNRWGSISQACFKCLDAKLSMPIEFPFGKPEIARISSVTETKESLFKSIVHTFLSICMTLSPERLHFWNTFL